MNRYISNKQQAANTKAREFFFFKPIFLPEMCNISRNEADGLKNCVRLRLRFGVNQIIKYYQPLPIYSKIEVVIFGKFESVSQWSLITMVKK